MQVTGIFGSSMEVLISVHGERVETREMFHCGSAYATVVSVDANGDPVAVPFYLAPETDVEKRRCQVQSQCFARCPHVNLMGALINVADRLIGAPTTSQSTERSASVDTFSSCKSGECPMSFRSDPGRFTWPLTSRQLPDSFQTSYRVIPPVWEGVIWTVVHLVTHAWATVFIIFL